MRIQVAESAGFCFGVERAVSRTYQCAAETDTRYCTLGPIIHNAQVVGDLEKKGVRVIHTLKELAPDETVIIRTHGVPKSVYDEMEANSLSGFNLPVCQKNPYTGQHTLSRRVSNCHYR